LKSTLLPIQQKMADFELMGKELKAQLNLKVLYILNPFWLIGFLATRSQHQH
jgi:hypothetical protein